MKLLQFLLFLTSAFLFSCASAPPEKVGSIQPGGPLPDELEAKFRVQGEGAVKAEDAKKAEPAPDPKAKKKTAKKSKPKKKKKKKFVYPSRRPKVDPIWVGEKMHMEVTYFGVAAGIVTLETLPHKTVNGRKVYHVRANAKSTKVFSLFYKLDDTIESFIDFEGFFSHRFNLVLNESKQTRDSLELYDSEKKQTYYWDRWNHYKKGYREKKEYHPIPAFPQDSLSALYYVRAMDLKNGFETEFPAVSEGKTWQLWLKVLRREKLDTRALGEVNTIVVQPITKFDGVVKQKGNSYIWLTDDDRRWVVRVEAKVKIGTVAAKLKKVEPGNRP